MKKIYFTIIFTVAILISMNRDISYSGYTSGFFKGYSYMQKKEYDRAIEEFKKVIEVEPKHAPSYSNLALCYESITRFGEAIATWEEYIRLLPMYEEKVKLHISLVEGMQKVNEELENAGDVKGLKGETVGLLENVSEDTYPNSIIRNIALKYLYEYFIGEIRTPELYPHPNPPPSAEGGERGESLVEEPSHIIDQVEEGEIEPISGDDIGGILLGLAKYYYLSALPDGRQASRQDEKDKNNDKVIRYLKEVMKLSGGMRRNASAQFLLIQSYGKTGSWAKRDELFVNYFKTKGRYYDKEVVLEMAKEIGGKYYKMRRYDDAVRIYSLILNRFPGEEAAEEARRMLNLCYENLGTFSQVLSEYAKSLIGVDKEKEASIREDMAGLYERQGNLRLAVENYEQVAEIYRNLGLNDKSISACQKIIQKTSGSEYGENAWYLAGLNYIDKGDDGQALATFKNIIKKYPKEEIGEKAQFLLGYQYLNMGDARKAKEEYERLVRLYPESGYVKGAKRMVERFRETKKRDSPTAGVTDWVWDSPYFSQSLAWAEEEKPNVILITIDTLRADHLSCYGYEKETSPNIDRIAKESVLFKDAISPSSWTTPTHMAILTGLYPSAHGVIDTNHKMAEDRITLAERLKEDGYKTAAFISAPGMMPYELGFGQGFDTYDDYSATFDMEYDLFGLNPERKGQNIRHMSPFTDRMVGEWLRRNHREKFFIFVHYWDVHGDYDPPKQYAELFEKGYKGNFKGSQKDIDNVNPGIKDEDLRHMVALYDGEIKFTDEYIGKLYERLNELNLLDNTILIIAADHGEEFMEHNGHWHGHTLYDELVHVPLIIHYPAGLPNEKVIDTQVSTIDIVPTVLELLKIEPKDNLQGRSLARLLLDGDSPDSTTSLRSVRKSGTVPLLEGQSPQSTEEREVYSETAINEPKKSVRTKRYKMIYRVKDKEEELYDLKGDPEELIDIAKTRQDEVKVLSKRLADWIDKTKEFLASRGKGEQIPEDEEKRKKLKSLGYLQ